MGKIWLKFGFELPKYMVLELIGKHSSCSEHIASQAIGIWLRIHFSEQILMHQLPSAIIFPKILHLKCQFEDLAEINIILLFNHTYYLLNKNPAYGRHQLSRPMRIIGPIQI